MKFRTALVLVITATFATFALVFGGIALGVATATAGNLPSVRPVATSTVIPGVFPIHDHVVSWNAHVSARDQILMMFGSLKAADTAGAVATSTAWSPALEQRKPVLVAWAACQMNNSGEFFISKRWSGQITAADCSAWWSGSDQTLTAFKGWD